MVCIYCNRENFDGSFCSTCKLFTKRSSVRGQCSNCKKEFARSDTECSCGRALVGANITVGPALSFKDLTDRLSQEMEYHESRWTEEGVRVDIFDTTSFTNHLMSHLSYHEFDSVDEKLRLATHSFRINDTHNIGNVSMNRIPREDRAKLDAEYALYALFADSKKKKKNWFLRTWIRYSAVKAMLVVGQPHVTRSLAIELLKDTHEVLREKPSEKNRLKRFMAVAVQALVLNIDGLLGIIRQARFKPTLDFLNNLLNEIADPPAGEYKVRFDTVPAGKDPADVPDFACPFEIYLALLTYESIVGFLSVITPTPLHPEFVAPPLIKTLRIVTKICEFADRTALSVVFLKRVSTITNAILWFPMNMMRFERRLIPTVGETLATLIERSGSYLFSQYNINRSMDTMHVVSPAHVRRIYEATLSNIRGNSFSSKEEDNKLIRDGFVFQLMTRIVQSQANAGLFNLVTHNLGILDSIFPEPLSLNGSYMEYQSIRQIVDNPPFITAEISEDVPPREEQHVSTNLFGNQVELDSIRELIGDEHMLLRREEAMDILIRLMDAEGWIFFDKYFPGVTVSHPIGFIVNPTDAIMALKQGDLGKRIDEILQRGYAYVPTIIEAIDGGASWLPVSEENILLRSEDGLVFSVCGDEHKLQLMIVGKQRLGTNGDFILVEDPQYLEVSHYWSDVEDKQQALAFIRHTVSFPYHIDNLSYYLPKQYPQV